MGLLFMDLEGVSGVTGKKNDGLSLIEIIISIGILAVVALMFISIFTNTHRLIVDAGDDSKNLIFSQKNVEHRMAQVINGDTVEFNINEIFPDVDPDLENEIFEVGEIKDNSFTTFVSITENAVPLSTTLTSLTYSGTYSGGSLDSFDPLRQTYSLYNTSGNKNQIKTLITAIPYEFGAGVDIDVINSAIAKYKADIKVTDNEGKTRTYTIYFYEGDE